MSTQIEVAEGTPADRPFVVAHHRALVIGSRTAMLMLLIAALAVLALGVIALVRGGPEVEGLLRALFGQVFAVVAGSMAAVLGIPAAIGLAAMSGANTEGAIPALGATPRRFLVATALITVGIAAVSVVLGGTSSLLVNLGLLGLVALTLLGLAGAVSFSPHRWRATLGAIALVVAALGTLWVIFAVGR